MITLIRWDDSLKVNVSELDAQHQKLIAMVNELYDAMRQRQGKAMLGTLIDNLVAYAGTHFRAEETYFIRFAYPEMEQHRREHAAFKKKIAEFKVRLEEHEVGIAGDIIDFLSTWIKHHIREVDRKYGPFLNEKGIV